MMAIKRATFVKLNWECLIPVLAMIFFLTSCVIISYNKFIHNDEVLCFYLLNDRSFRHMLVAWSDKFTQAPPLFFILGWLWDKIFGSSLLSLRLFSSISFGLSCIAVWIVIRRSYDFWSATIGTLSVFCLSRLVLYLNAEVKWYGLFTLVCAFGLFQFDSLNREDQPSWKSLIINGLTHCAIVLTHLYGAFYSGAILGAFVVRDYYFGTFRKSVYLSVAFSWIILFLLSPILISQSDNSAKWFVPYSLWGTINLSMPFPQFYFFILLLLVISSTLYVTEMATVHNKLNVVDTNGTQLNSRIALLIFAVCVLTVPFLAWVITATIKPIFNDRYILPTITLSWPILLTHFVAQVAPDRHFDFTAGTINRGAWIPFTSRTIIFAALTLALLLYPLYYATEYPQITEHPGYPELHQPGATDINYGYSDLPIALEAGHDFLPRFYYSAKPSRYFHILDWETAVNNATSVFATGDYVFIEALSRQYPFIQSIQSADFLKKYDRFLVLNEGEQNYGGGKWFETRIKNNPDYQVKQLGREQGVTGPLEMILVEKTRMRQ